MALIGFYDDIFLAHHQWQHPERPERLQAARRTLRESGLLDEMQWPDFNPATLDQVYAVHDPVLWQRLRQLSALGGGNIDADTYVNAFSCEAASAAAGAAIAAVECALSEPGTVPVALIRPPGHHATTTRSMGFCLINNSAIAARHALDKLGIDRVAIVDWDVHHGNGTEEIFYEDPAVLTISIHQFPFYPGTGRMHEVGNGAGWGSTLNVPLPAGSGDTNYERMWDLVVTPALETFRPDLILLGAGFDAHWRDPLAGTRLTIDGYHALATRLRTTAAALGAPVAVVLEGGYDLEALGHGLRATMLALDGRDLQYDPLGDAPAHHEPNVQPLIDQLRRHHPLLNGAMLWSEEESMAGE